jgi:hypothetical protein
MKTINKVAIRPIKTSPIPANPRVTLLNTPPNASDTTPTASATKAIIPKQHPVWRSGKCLVLYSNRLTLHANEKQYYANNATTGIKLRKSNIAPMPAKFLLDSKLLIQIT